MGARKLTIQWKRRGVRRETEVASVMAYFSLCGEYCLERHQYKLGNLRERWFAMHRQPDQEDFKILSRHATRTAAQGACNKHRLESCA